MTDLHPDRIVRFRDGHRYELMHRSRRGERITRENCQPEDWLHRCEPGRCGCYPFDEDETKEQDQQQGQAT